MRVLGVGYVVAHDSHVGVVCDGAIEMACSEERFSRRKKDGRIPVRALAHAAEHCQPPHAVVAPYYDAQQFAHSHERIADTRRRASFAAQIEQHEALLRALGVTHFMGHHASHAAGAYYSSGFDDAIVLTYDGGISCEPWLATVSRGCGRTLKVVRELTFLDGATAAVRYSAVTSLLGFRPIHDEGKITGLVARAAPDDGCCRDLRLSLGALTDLGSHYNGRFAERYSWIAQKYPAAVIASSIQFITTESVIGLLRECVDDPSATNIVVAGGLFANILLNRTIKQLGFRQLFVYPAMGDEGLAVGAALAYGVSNGDVPEGLDDVCVGPRYTPHAIVEALNAAGLAFERPEDIDEAVASLLAEGLVVARFDGPMEFGPRALGNRSILYRSDDCSLNQWLNQKLGRTETMPFAPVTLDEHAAEMYADLNGVERCTPFMTTAVTCTARMQALSPAVVHRDGTARPQVVAAGSSPRIHRILTLYHRYTGIPSLVNTSFNLHNEPIVMSPTDAIRTFLAAGIDCLAIGECLVRHPRRSAEVAG
jgi:carbamoyltransferase